MSSVRPHALPDPRFLTNMVCSPESFLTKQESKPAGHIAHTVRAVGEKLVYGSTSDAGQMSIRGKYRDECMTHDTCQHTSVVPIGRPFFAGLWSPPPQPHWYAGRDFLNSGTMRKMLALLIPPRQSCLRSDQVKPLQEVVRT